MKNKTIMFLAAAVVALSMPAVQASNNADTLEYFLTTLPLMIPNEASLRLSQEFRYNDNIDETSNKDARDSFITDTSVEGALTRSTGHLTWGVAGDVGYEHYFNRPKSNHRKDFTYSIAPVLGGDIQLGSGAFMLRLNSSFRNVEMDQSKNETVMRADNGAAAVYDAGIGGRSGLTLTADFQDIRYGASKYRDNETDTYGGSVAPYYKLTERQRLGLDASLRHTQYRTNKKHDDYNAVEFKLFDNYTINARTTLYTSVGAKRNYYESGSASKHNSGSGWDMTALAALRYIITENLASSIRVGRDTTDSQSGNARGKRIDTLAGVSLDWRLTGKLVFRNGFVFTDCNEKTSDDDVRKYLYNTRLEYTFRENLNFYLGYNFNCKRYKYLDKKNFVANEFIFGASYYFSDNK